MKAIVIYDSQFGNTAQIAQAIYEGLSQALNANGEVTLHHISDIAPDQVAKYDLLVVGSPTQKFRPTSAMTNFLKRIPGNALQGVKVAAFDTRITEEEIQTHAFFSKLVEIFGFAADPISERLGKKGGEILTRPVGFTVEGTEGPLSTGELEWAKAWAAEILQQAA